MAVTAVMFSDCPLNAFKKVINDLNAGGSVIKCALFTSAVAPSQENHSIYTDVTSACTQVTGTGYTIGGATLTTKSWTEGTKVSTFTSDAVSWSSSTITARYAVFYDSVSGYLLFYLDFGADYSSTDGTFQITPSGSGWFNITVP